MMLCALYLEEFLKFVFLCVLVCVLKSIMRFSRVVSMFSFSTHKKHACLSVNVPFGKCVSDSCVAISVYD